MSSDPPAHVCLSVKLPISDVLGTSPALNSHHHNDNRLVQQKHPLGPYCYLRATFLAPASSSSVAGLANHTAPPGALLASSAPIVRLCIRHHAFFFARLHQPPPPSLSLSLSCSPSNQPFLANRLQTRGRSRTPFRLLGIRPNILLPGLLHAY